MSSLHTRLQRSVAFITSRNDLILAVVVVSIIFMMILPLPTFLVDALIATNMSLSAILLMVAMYLPSPLGFSSFPTVLLVTTLFRLGISIATTRLILLDGDAGHIVDTFGNFVVGGNLVVGLVVFLILTIVQFVVITKGAERVAEVAARFSLDAMPGKQMSIDGDLRANTIDMEEAKRRHGIVEKESQLYGAMDGAMKFVKGDAIAGLIIVAVNLVGGMIIGTMQRGLTAAEAVHIYSILTIGDGLIAQIPALFIAICAGMIVTRVTSDSGKPSNIGRDIGEQILARPRPLLIGASIMLGMGLIPGMPTFTFLGLALVIGAVGYGLSQPRNRDKQAGDDIESLSGAKSDAASKKEGTAAEEDLTPTVPLLLDVAEDLRKSFSAKQLNDELIAIRRALYFDLGVPFPGIQLRFNQQLAPGTYSIQLSEVPVAEGRLRPDHVLVRESRNNIATLGVEIEEEAQFLPHLEMPLGQERSASIADRRGHPDARQRTNPRLPPLVRAQEACRRLYRYPGNASSAHIDGIPVRRAGQGSHSHHAVAEDCGNSAAAGLRKHFRAQSARHHGIVDRVGAEGERLGAADGICPRHPQASDMPPSHEWAERAPGVSVIPRSGGNDSWCDPPDLWWELPRPRSEHVQTRSGTSGRDGGRQHGTAAPASAAHIDGYSSLCEKDGGRGMPRSARPVISGADAGYQHSAAGPHRGGGMKRAGPIAGPGMRAASGACEGVLHRVHALENAQETTELEGLSCHVVQPGNPEFAAALAQRTSSLQHDSQSGRADGAQIGEVKNQVFGALRQHFLHLTLKFRRSHAVDTTAYGDHEGRMSGVGNDSHETAPGKNTSNVFRRLLCDKRAPS